MLHKAQLCNSDFEKLCNSDFEMYTSTAVLRLRRSICHMRGYIFTNARKIYYHLRVSFARF